MMNRWACIAAALVVTATAGRAQAADTWSSPFPGIQHLHRTGPSKLNLHAAVVDLCAAGISVRHTAFEERKQKTSSFATAVGAQLTINADFSCRPIDVDPVKSPFKPCVNKPAYVTYGIAAHAGVPWPQTLAKDALLAFGNERAQIWDDAENKDFDPAWMQEVLSGHWSLVLDGKLTGADCPIDPRTGVGLSADGNKLILIVVDGRNGWKGMTCIEMAKVLIELGADRAFNLDGGGSSTFWQKGVGVLNHPSDGVERVVGPPPGHPRQGRWAVAPLRASVGTGREVPAATLRAAGPARVAPDAHAETDFRHAGPRVGSKAAGSGDRRQGTHGCRHQRGVGR